jgi:PAS domain S-box-containing protein
MEAAMAEILINRSHLLDSVQVAFLVTDGHSTILYANRPTEHLLGYTRDEITGQRIRVLFLDEDLVYFLPNIVYLTLYKNGFNGEVLLRKKDGAKVFVHVITSSFKEDGERFLSFSFQVIQRIKSLEKEKLEAERWVSLGKMVEEIAHQIRNPAVSIGGYANRLLKGFRFSPKGKFYLVQILQGTKRLETILHRVEEYIRMPRLTFKKERVEEVVERSLQSLSGEAAEKGISISLEARGLEENGYSFIDRELVMSALSHIVRNSLDAVTLASPKKQKKRVKVSLFEEEGNLGISVTDNGEGISKKNLGFIFDPFFSTRPDRVGLGLTFVRRVMEEHQGRIHVESRLKRGTTFTLCFPKDRRRKVRRELISPEAAPREA